MFVLVSGFSKRPIVLLPEALQSIPHLCNHHPLHMMQEEETDRERGRKGGGGRRGSRRCKEEGGDPHAAGPSPARLILYIVINIVY